MAISGGDGSIILTTKVDTGGIEKGMNNAKNAVEKTNQSVNNLGKQLSQALASGDTKSAQLINNFKKATDQVEKQAAKVEELKAKLESLESGKIVVDDKGVSKLSSDFQKVNADIEKTQQEINQLYMQLDALQANAFKAPDTGDVVFTPAEQAEFERLNAKLDELEPQLEKNKQKANELGAALRNATGTATQAEIEKTKIKLEESERQMQDLQTKAEIAGQKMASSTKGYQKQVYKSEKAVRSLGKRIASLAASALIFSAITKAFTEMRKTIGSLLMSNEQFRQSVYELEAALWVLATPIYEFVLPGLQTLVRWITIGILYVTAFFSALGGKSLQQSIENAKALKEQADAYEEVAEESKEARKQLAAFDEINIINSGIDDVEKPSFDGIENGFDSLQEIISSEDMKNLQAFEEWVKSNKDAIKTALEVAGVVALGAGIVGLIWKIGELLGWFTKKDDALDQQTAKTQKETEAVTNLAESFAYAAGLVPGLAWGLDKLGESGLVVAPAFKEGKDTVLAYSDATEELKQKIQELEPVLQPLIEKENEVSASTEGIISATTNLVSELVEWATTTETTTYSAAESYAAYMDAVIGVGKETQNLSVFTSNALDRLGLVRDKTADASEGLMVFKDAVLDANGELLGFKKTAEDFISSFDDTSNEFSETATYSYDTHNKALTNAEKRLHGFSKTTKDSYSDYTKAVTNAEKETTKSNQTVGKSTEDLRKKIAKEMGITEEKLEQILSNARRTPKLYSKELEEILNLLVQNMGMSTEEAKTTITGLLSSTEDFFDSSEYRSTKWKNNVIANISYVIEALGKLMSSSIPGVGTALLPLPGLATGAVLPPNKPFLAMVGDQKNGTNIEAPLQTIVDAMNIALAQNRAYGGGNSEIVLELNGRELGRAVVEQGNLENHRIGTRLVVT